MESVHWLGKKFKSPCGSLSVASSRKRRTVKGGERFKCMPNRACDWFRLARFLPSIIFVYKNLNSKWDAKKEEWYSIGPEQNFDAKRICKIKIAIIIIIVIGEALKTKRKIK